MPVMKSGPSGHSLLRCLSRVIPVAFACVLFAAQASAQQIPERGYGYGPMMGPGMMGYGGGPGAGWGQGWGPGMMGPGMMGPGMMGYGWGPGMMGQGWGPGGGMGPSRMALVDANHDGFVGADEAAAWHESVFAAFDADGDEVVTREEYLAGHMGYGPGTGPRSAQMAQQKEARFKGMDKDGDGKLTLEEFLAYAAERHKTADKDGDGKVTVWEYRAARRW